MNGPAISAPCALGDYWLERELLRGGQGVVFEGRRSSDGLRVAFKLMLRPGDKATLRFRQEAQVLMRLEHPHLPRVLELGAVDGCPFMAMELIEGRDLDQLVKRGGPLPAARLPALLGPVARALAHCHGVGLVHRDVKPGNIILEEATQRPVLIDFGLVQRDASEFGRLSIDDLTRLSLTGELKDALLHGPEQADGGRVGPAADVYALGATLFFLLAGRPPFEGQSAIGLIRMVLDAPPPDVRQLADVPDALAELCLRCLAKQPEARPTATAFAAALEGSVRAPGRGPGPLPLALAGVIVLGAMGGALMILGGEARDPLDPTPAAAATDEPPPAPDDPRAQLAEAIGAWRRDELDRCLVLARRVAEGGDRAAQEARFLMAVVHVVREQPAEARRELEAVAASDDPWLISIAHGLERSARGDDAVAREAFDRAIGLRPDDPDALYLRASVIERLGDGPRALRDLNRAVELDPTFVRAITYRALLQLRLSDPDAAERDVARALALDPKRGDAHRARGLIERGRDAHAAAEAAFTRALAADPKDLEAWALRASREALGNLQGAVEDMGRAAELDPRRAGPELARLREALARAGGPDLGAGLDAEALLQRGITARREGRLADALADFDRAVELAPDSAHARAQRGSARKASGDFAGAERDLGRAIELDAGRPGLHAARGEARLRLKDWRGAAEDYAIAIERDPAALDLRQNLAAAQNYMGDRAGAVATLDRALGLSPDHAGLLTARGVIKQTMGDDAGAIEDLERALKLAPPDSNEARQAARALEQARRGRR